MVKRLAAVASGATMLGATAMGALAAADLSNYPNQFVTDGTFNGYFVVGEKAASVDNLAMTDIASSMKVAKAAGATTTTTVEGDAWLVGTSSKKLEMANNNASGLSVATENLRDINNFISDGELSALADGKWATNEADYGFNQYLYFDNTPAGVSASVNRIVKYVEDDKDKTTDYFFVASSGQIGRYRLEFTSNAQSDVTDSTGASDTTGTYLDDFEDTKLGLLGREYTVVQARRLSAGGDANQNGIKLVLMSGATSDTLLEGESKTYSVGDKVYDLTVTFVDADECKFSINGEATNKLKDGDTYVLSDKSEVGVSEVLYQDYAGGVHSCTFFLGARKMELRDDTVTDGINSHQMRVGSEDIDGADVVIEATDDNTTFSVSVISVNMTADDDYFVGAGEKLSDVIGAAGDEKEVLMDGALDYEYKGLTDEKTHDLRVRTSSSRRYKLSVFDGDGNAVDIPLAYANAANATGNVSLGEEAPSGTRTNQKRLVLKEGEIVARDDYFILTGASTTSAGAVNGDGSAKSYLLQYSGSDRRTKTSPKIRFKNQGSGESLEYSATGSATATSTVATIKIGGFSFDTLNTTSQESDDFSITVDMNGNGWVMGTVENTTGNHASVTFVDYYGAELGFHWISGIYHNNTPDSFIGTTGIHGIAGFVGVNLSTPDGNDFDNVAPTLLSFNVTGTNDPEVRLSTPTGMTLLTPDGETEVSYGYTSLGSFLKFQEPSGDPDELTLTYPEKQRLPQVYITSGATKSSSATTGDLVAVTVVDATKLDSEVASATAQNLVVVGGPCVNTVAAELLGNPADCTTGFAPGKARVKLWEHANGNVAMLVAGYSGADTRLAGKVVAHRWKELSGSEVEVEGTTYSDATLSAPSAE